MVKTLYFSFLYQAFYAINKNIRRDTLIECFSKNKYFYLKNFILLFAIHTTNAKHIHSQKKSKMKMNEMQNHTIKV